MKKKKSKAIVKSFSRKEEKEVCNRNVDKKKNDQEENKFQLILLTGDFQWDFRLIHFVFSMDRQRQCEDE